ncbi:MAG TPA: hypothetical protein VFT62_08835 [Mycobacteriales bacterium]|nr:hypothetical protein [Mycobacteriales bacterium]
MTAAVEDVRVPLRSDRRRAAFAAVVASAALLVGSVVTMFVCGRGLAALGNTVDTIISALLFLLLGLVICVRRPTHPIGHSFVAAAFFFAVQAFTTAYADAGLRPHGPHLVAAGLAGNFTQWIFAPGVLFGYTLPFLWFPGGAALSRSARVVAAVSVAGTLVTCGANFLAAGPLNNYPHVDNPYGWHAPLVAGVGGVGLVVYVVGLFAAIGAVFTRYRRSHGIERLQMRWFIVGVAATCAAFVVQLTLLVTTGDVGAGVVLLAVLPVTASFAILRYRLFDIDRVISRSATYAIVTAVLIAPYVVLTAFAAQLGHGSNITVAALTLFTLALLRPLRRRVQARVDRRFNRERYDAGRIVDGFAIRLRDEIDPDVVRDDLLTVAASAIQPSTVSLWVSPAGTP